MNDERLQAPLPAPDRAGTGPDQTSDTRARERMIDLSPSMPAAVSRYPLSRHRRDAGPGEGGGAEFDQVAEEVPVALEYNGVSHAVMMASPQDLEDFAVGFSLTEGIASAVDEIFDVETVVDPRGVRVLIELASERFVQLKERRRNLTGRTGCGICGAENLAQALREPSPLPGDAFRLSAERVHAALEQMAAKQALQQATGATHAAGWVDASGQLVKVREDVGRHNALDKLLGSMACERAAFGQGAVIVSSRASVEMVQKAAMMGVPILATVSGPTALAIRMADSVGMTLAAWFRSAGHARYTHGWRLDAA